MSSSRSICLVVVTLLFTKASFAAGCKSGENWIFKGNIAKKLDAYVKLRKSVDHSKDETAKLNASIKRDGFPIAVSVGKATSKDHIEFSDEGPGGLDGYVFMRTLKPEEGLDDVYEVEMPDSKKALRKWSVAFNQGPLAIRDDELIFRENLPVVCGLKHSSVTFATKPDHSFKVIDFDQEPTYKNIPNERCKAIKAVYKQTSYGTCAEFTDLTSGKKRILIWQEPMT